MNGSHLGTFTKSCLEKILPIPIVLATNTGEMEQLLILIIQLVLFKNLQILAARPNIS
jgi:hypothetical protein